MKPTNFLDTFFRKPYFFSMIFLVVSRKNCSFALLNINILIMATITLRPENLKSEETKKGNSSKMFSWEELTGIFASDKSDKELRDEYLEEKYGI